MYRGISKSMVVAMKLMNLMSENAVVCSLLSVSNAFCWVEHLRTALTAALATACRQTGLLQRI